MLNAALLWNHFHFRGAVFFFFFFFFFLSYVKDIKNLNEKVSLACLWLFTFENFYLKTLDMFSQNLWNIIEPLVSYRLVFGICWKMLNSNL